jgi:dihydrofolate synthase/folylpolyglutamate synthase
MRGDRLVLDGAHNPHGVRATVQTWREVFGDEKATVIFGAASSRDPAPSLALLGRIAARMLFITLQSPRAAPAGSRAASAPPGVEHRIVPSLPEALRIAQSLPERTLICGSLFLCGEALALSHRLPFEVSAQ